MCPVILLVCAVSACTGELDLHAWTPEEPACRAGDVIGLEGGLHAHLLASDDGGASWDYAPERPLEAGVVGTWDRETGDFAWTRTYARRHWRKAEEVEGVGTAYPNGDLDVRYERRLRRVGAKGWRREVRVVRTGCAQEATERTLDGALLTVERGTYGRKGYVYTIEREREGAVITVDGLLRWSGRRTESQAWRVGDHEYVATREDDGAGTVTTAYREVIDGVVFEGLTEQRPSGEEHHVLTQTHPSFEAYWDYRVDARGDGGGTVRFEAGIAEPFVCDVTFDDGACDLDCPGNAFTTCGLP